MGVDFRMRAVRPRPDGSFDPIPGEGLEFSTRLVFLETLLRPGHQEGSPAPILRSLLPPFVSFRWFEGCYAGAYRESPPPSTEDCAPPREIVNCLRAVLGILRDRADAFPPLYLLREEGTGRQQEGWKAVYESRVYTIRGGWGRCDASPAETEPHIPYPMAIGASTSAGSAPSCVDPSRSAASRPAVWGTCCGPKRRCSSRRNRATSGLGPRWKR